MDRENPNVINVKVAKEKYGWIQGSRVSWRKKSSYRKAIKRRSSKIARSGSKKLTRNI